MSKMGNHLINTADDRARADAEEAAWLHEEVARLEAVIRRAREALPGRDDLDGLKRFALAHAPAGTYGPVVEVMRGIRAAREILGERIP